MVILPTTGLIRGASIMLMLTGEYEHTLDEKNRLFVSNKLRGQIDSDEYGSNFYLALGPHGILGLYPERYFQRLVLAGSAGTAPADESVAFERLGFALACRVELDRQGRLLLPDKLRRRANLGATLTLVGVRDHIELWNSHDWERYLQNNLARYQSQMMQARQAVLQEQIRQMEF